MSEELKNYFKTMFSNVDKNIVLDDDQINAILSDDKYALILAGAGTGKTTTMVAKVKYLVDIKKVDPSKILVISYTKKAVQELEERIVYQFGINACVTTFHSLGYKYLKEIYNNRKCIVIDSNERDRIFLEYFKSLFKNKEKVKELISIFSEDIIKDKQWYFSKYFKENYEKYNTYDEFFSNYKNGKILEAKEIGIKKVIDDIIYKQINGDYIFTIKGEKVRSDAEAIIANFLFIHGINYEYEKVYDELMDDNSIYKPDFTLELAGQEVYIEYFGLDNYKYNIIKNKKEKYHKEKHNKFISLDKIPLNEVESVLNDELIKVGFKYKMKTDEEIYDQLLNNLPLSQLYPFESFIYECIDAIKESINRDQCDAIVKRYIDSLTDAEKSIAIKQYAFINDFYRYYQNSLYGAENYYFDYPDLLYYSGKYLNSINTKKFDFEYIIIDEYQDVSRARYDLAKKTADKYNSNVFVVGDDWQSIYAFSGSRIDYIYNFNKYFPNAKLYKIMNTYRNSQELIDTTGTFIMRNESQIKKSLISEKHNDNPIKIITYNTDIDLSEEEYNGERFKGYQEYSALEKLILQIHNENPDHRILVLARKNKIISRCFKNPKFKDSIDTKITFVGYEDIDIEGMSMHKSKGLTFDEVIIIGLDKYFPMDDFSKYWMKALFKNQILQEKISYAEERRLFYVALTRTKNNVYLLVNENPGRRSSFVDEIENILKNTNMI